MRLAGGDARRALTYLEAAALGLTGGGRIDMQALERRWTGPPSATTATATSTTT